MKRRKVLKGIFLFSLGTPFIFSCSDPFKAVSSLGLDKLNFTNDHLSFIDMLSKAILPIQNIPILSDHTTLPFVMKMVNDVYDADDRTIFQEVYSNADQYFKTLLNFDITSSNTDQINETVVLLNEKLTTNYSDKESIPYKLSRFFSILKKENLQYLRTSQYIQENYRYYELVPGRYNGNFPISELPKPNVSYEQ